MGLLDFFKPPKRHNPIFGDLVYRRGAWNGEVTVGELCDGPIPLEIQTSKDAELAAFYPVLENLRANVPMIKRHVTVEAFKLYERYVEADRRTGNFTDADYAQHPSVLSAVDMWGVLEPFRLTLTAGSPEYDSIVWLDVDWPNPHYFAAYLHKSNLFLLDVDG
jgi:hypothetical protein